VCPCACSQCAARQISTGPRGNDCFHHKNVFTHNHTTTHARFTALVQVCVRPSCDVTWMILLFIPPSLGPIVVKRRAERRERREVKVPHTTHHTPLSLSISRAHGCYGLSIYPAHIAMDKQWPEECHRTLHTPTHRCVFSPYLSPCQDFCARSKEFLEFV
jgi:hypothetical protein